MARDIYNPYGVDNPNYNPNAAPGTAGSLAPDAPITSASLQPTSDILFKQPMNVPIASVAGLDTSITALEPTAQENQQSDIITRLRSLQNQTVGRSEFQAQQEQAQGIPDLIKTQNDLSSKLKGLQNEALAIPQQLQLEAEGRGVTQGGLRPIEAGALRRNAIQALGVSSLLEASRGNLATAQTLVDRAVAQKFDPVTEEINALTANLELIRNDPRTTLADKNRANAQLAIQEARKTKVEEQKADSKTIASWAAAALANGASNIQAQKIMDIAQSENPDLKTAFALFAPFAVDPNATEKALADLAYTRAQTRQVLANAGKIEAETGKTRAEIAALANSGNLEELTYGTPEYTLAAIKNSSKYGDKRLLADERKNVQASKRALASLELYNTIMNKGLDNDTSEENFGVKSGVIRGRISTLAGIWGADPNAAAVNAVIQGIIPTVARGIFQEVGVLTDQDIANYKKVVPDINKPENANKLIELVLLKTLERSYADTLLTAAQNQTNVSNFAAEYEDVLKRIDRLTTTPSAVSTLQNSSGETVVLGADGKYYLQ